MLVTDQDADAMRRQFELNFMSAFLLIHHGLPLMQADGAIVCISSAVVGQANRGLSAYSAVKAALERYVRAAAFELGKAGIRINTVRPGVTRPERIGMETDDMREPPISGQHCQQKRHWAPMTATNRRRRSRSRRFTTRCALPNNARCSTSSPAGGWRSPSLSVTAGASIRCSAWMKVDNAVGVDDPALEPMDLAQFKTSGILQILTPEQAQVQGDAGANAAGALHDDAGRASGAAVRRVCASIRRQGHSGISLG